MKPPRFHEPRPLLVLDLDETLIRSDDHTPTDPTDHDITITLSDVTIWVRPRPHLKEFLREVQNKYDLIIWSPGRRDYVHAVVQHVLADFNIVLILTGDDCTRSPNDFRLMKNLEILWRTGQYDSRTTRVLDDRRDTCSHPDSVIVVAPYYGAGNDTELLRARSILQQPIHAN
jgi:hypothetical protein